jgi:peptide-methionine (R)-S-oxide reductase
MKDAVFMVTMAAALASCGGGNQSPRPTAPAPSPPAAPAEAEPVLQAVGEANINPQNKQAPNAALPAQHEPIMEPKQDADAKIVKTDAEWRAQLTPEEYHILRRKGTERPFTGKFDHHFKDGTYTCKGCGTPLFLSGTKYNSGCGWPAFYDSIKGTIDTVRDTSHGMIRIEITCKKCGGHLGHIFDDGPNPTGLRYCVNSGSMGFIPAEKKPGTSK